MLSTIVIVILALLLSAFFSGSEIAFVSANKLGVEVLKNKGEKRGKILADMYAHPKSFLSTMLVGNNIALVIFTIFMTKLLAPLLHPYFGNGTLASLLATTVLVTLIVLIFGEFLPKTIFRLYANDILYKTTYFLLFIKYVLAIPATVMTWLSDFLLKRIIKVSIEDVDNVLTRVDLKHYIIDTLGEEIEVDKEILTNALNLNQIKVRECMIPRNEIISIDINDSIDDLMDTFKKSKLSRIIVKDGDIENIVGYIHHQQLLDNPKDLKPLILPIKYVPEAMNAQDLMQQFIKEETTIACVVDEFGGTAGLITMEDILEEIFGEIEDEHDEEDFIERQITEKEFLFSGRLEIDFINEKYPQIDIPQGEYHTLSGYIVMTTESIPKEGDEFEIGHYKFIVESVSDTKIETVKVIVLDLDIEEHEEQEP